MILHVFVDQILMFFRFAGENTNAGSGDSNQAKFIGWEKNSKGKLSPRYVNLADSMDPTK